MTSIRLRCLTILITLSAGSTLLAFPQPADPPFLRYLHHTWVDSVLNSLTPDQRIAQCIWIASWSNRDISHEVEVADIIRKNNIGGIIFFQGNPAKQAEMTRYFQKISKTPLLISMDAEWGVGMRLENVVKFPYQMTLGAITNDTLIYLMGKAVAEQCKQMGVNINLAPVTDINNNPHNPVINYRSFGEARENVAGKALMYMKGMQDNGVLATLKHFPGHGNTDIDSHYDLPVINTSFARLDSFELYPFSRLISMGAGCVMTAHLSLPEIDTTSKQPSSLSPFIIKGILGKHLNFRGLIITDAMNMKGVTKFFRPGETEALALAAGNDVAEFVTDVDAAIKETNKLIEQKKLSWQDIDNKCRKILAVKYWSGLYKMKNIDISDIDERLSSGPVKALIHDLYANAITVLSNKDGIIPLKTSEQLRIATVSINKEETTLFQKRIKDYYPVENFFISSEDTAGVLLLKNKLKNFNIVIVAIYGTDQRPQKDFGISPALNDLLARLTGRYKTIAVYFGNPYAINRIHPLQNTDGLILTYQENEFTEDLSAQLISGGIGAKGSLPVTVNNNWPAGFGLTTPGNLRVRYGFPENAGLSSVTLVRLIDSVAKAGLSAKAYPGCEIIAAKDGIVVFHKTYGFHTYDERIAVSENDLYDLASVTKIAAGLPGLMVLNSEGKFSPDEKLGKYLPDFRRSDKGNIIMRDLLAHQSGLTAWIPFWKETLKKNGHFRKNIFNPGISEKYSSEVAEGIYINRNYRKKIFREIRKSPLGEKKYLYSDLGFILVPEIIERLSGEIWNEYVTRKIYHRIGAFDMVFNPAGKYPPSRIIPTEYDSLFRKQLIHGTVHDEGAAMLGGVSGHAGLFATANDLMKLMELYRRMGEYGGERLISAEVLRRYSSVQFPGNNNRRGLGFDKPLPDNSDPARKNPYPTRSASPSGFGHSGYTGTFVWIDPDYGISYVFLSNRVYPTRNNNSLTELNIRTGILQAIYDSIIKDKR